MARIFLVEDDLSTQMLLKSLLRTRHHEIIGIAENTDGAKSGIIKSKPDLCLIDVNLFDSSGMDVAEYVIEHLGIPVVMMSADNHPTLPIPFILKPISPSNLFATIDRAINTERS
jgi:two-component SAPR family response regulator